MTATSMSLLAQVLAHHIKMTSSENTVPKQVFEAYESDINVSSSTSIGTSYKKSGERLDGDEIGRE